MAFSILSDRGGQYLGDVLNTDSFILATDDPIEVHEAGHIDSCENLGAGLFVVVHAVAAHHARYGFLGNCEQAAETAAFVGPCKLREFDAVERLQQLPRLVEFGTNEFTVGCQTQLAQSVAALMQANAMRVRAGHAIDLEHIGKELAQFVGPRPHAVEFGGAA